MIENVFNYDDVFFRDLTICVLSMLENKLTWVNRFSAGDVDVEVDVYYSLTGKSDFLLDAFTDDVLGSGRKLELNTDSYPRGHLTLTSWSYISGEFANPNVYVRQIVTNDHFSKTELAKLRALPIEANYELSILVNSELDVWKASQAIAQNLSFFRYMHFEYNFLMIDAVSIFPDNEEITINREVDMAAEEVRSIDLKFKVRTYFPAINENQQFGPPKRSKWINQLR